ncbi:hypothetical protein HMI56_003256 [Coelomomyces lativittatus]|nr:hypothetical protein HMI56_003256 [Coelomomyces lativittatus]
MVSHSPSHILNKVQPPFPVTWVEPKLWNSQLLSDWKEQTHELIHVLKVHQKYLVDALKKN